MAEDHAERIQASLQRLAPKFAQRTQGQLQVLNKLTECARQGDASVLAELRRMAHAIHGTGSMFGFAELSARAGELERLLDTVVAGAVDSKVDSSVLQALVACSEKLASEIEVTVRSSLGPAHA